MRVRGNLLLFVGAGGIIASFILYMWGVRDFESLRTSVGVLIGHLVSVGIVAAFDRG